MTQEYFTARLTDSIEIGLSLEDMTTVAQFDLKSICVIPGVAPFWYGVVNFQGSLLWVLDGGLFFGIDSDRNLASQQLTALVLNRHIGGTKKRVALVVKQLQGILTVDPSKLTPALSSLPATLKNLCTVNRDKQERTTCIVDTEAFLQQLYQQSILVSA